MKKQDLTVKCVGEIDPQQIPEHIGCILGRAIYNAMLEDSSKPGFWEGFERWEREREAARAR